METINDRIESIVNHEFAGNKASFCKATGLIASGISNYIGTQRRSKPSVDMVVKIIKATDVDPWWLLTGEGDYKRGSEQTTQSGHHNQQTGRGAHHNVNGVNEADLRKLIARLESQLTDKERIIKMYENKANDPD